MKNIFKRAFCIILSVMLASMLISCDNLGSIFQSKERYQTSFLDLFDTASTIIAYDDSDEAFDEHYAEFHDKLEEYYKLYDIYDYYDGINNLYTLNHEAKDGPVEVDQRIIDLLKYGKYVYELTDGETNICFGAVLELWHDCREAAENDPDNAALPDSDKLEEASKHTDIDSLVIDEENCTVTFTDPELQLDVGAIAKGYAVEQICEWAKENLWSSAAISIGGNVCTFGYKNDDGKTLWNIGIENPDSEADDYLLNVEITDLCVVTSGDYQRYYTVDGVKYCHIIDPDTLYPARYFSAVSVLCEDSALGDALSTALFNMTLEEGQALVENTDNVEAVWVDSDYNLTYSSGFEQYIYN